MIRVQKARHLDVTTMFTYSHANRLLGQSEHTYYLSYLINNYNNIDGMAGILRGHFDVMWEKLGSLKVENNITCKTVGNLPK